MIFPGRRLTIFTPDFSPKESSPKSLHLISGFDFLFSPAVPLPTVSPETYLKASAFLYSLTNVTSLAVPFILKDSLLLSPVQVGLLSAICATPSFLKPIASLFIPKRSRSLALTTCGLVQSAVYIGIGLTVAKPLTIASVPIVGGCLFVYSASSAVGMVIRDTMLMETASTLEGDSAAHFLFSDVSMIQRVGLLPVSYLSGYLLDYISPGTVLIGAAVCPALVALFACFLGSDEDHRAQAPAEQWEKAVGALTDVNQGWMSTVMGRSQIAQSLIPSYADAMFFFYTNEIGFSPEFLGRFQLVGSVAGICGNIVSRSSIKYVDASIAANAAMIATVPLTISLLYVTTHATPAVATFVLCRHFLMDFCGALINVPASVQLMRSAPKGAEGTYLALTSTVSDCGGLVNSVISSSAMHALGISATQFANLSTYVIINNACTAAAVPALLFTPQGAEKGKNENASPKIDELEEFNVRLGNMSPRDA